MTRFALAVLAFAAATAFAQPVPLTPATPGGPPLPPPGGPQPGGPPLPKGPIDPAKLVPGATAGPQLLMQTPLGGYRWIADLAGGCWTGVYPDGATKDTQCYQVEYGRFIAGTIAISAPGKPAFQGRGIMIFDPRRDRLVFWSWASSGNYNNSEGQWDGAVLRFPDPVRVDPNLPGSRSSWTRLDADSYKVARERKEGEEWKEQFVVTYKRDAKPDGKKPAELKKVEPKNAPAPMKGPAPMKAPATTKGPEPMKSPTPMKGPEPVKGPEPIKK